jgi:hypothetical protein
MYAAVGWIKRLAFASALLPLIYIGATQVVSSSRTSVMVTNDAWTLGAAPSDAAGAELCTYFSSPPPVLTTAQLGQVRCDANQISMVDAQGPGSVASSPASNPVMAGIQDSGGVDYINGCDKMASGNPATTSDAVLIAHSASKVIYICGYTIEGSGAVNVSFESAAAGSCGTETQLGSTFYLGAQSGISDPSPFYRGMSVPSGSDLCTHLSAAVATAFQVYYAQR